MFRKQSYIVSSLERRPLQKSNVCVVGFRTLMVLIYWLVTCFLLQYITKWEQRQNTVLIGSVYWLFYSHFQYDSLLERVQPRSQQCSVGMRLLLVWGWWEVTCLTTTHTLCAVHVERIEEGGGGGGGREGGSGSCSSIMEEHWQIMSRNWFLATADFSLSSILPITDVRPSLRRF